jgi:hypothetical protein
MVALSELWLPIILSAVFVFVAANILWMALPFWHMRDYRRLPEEGPVIDALSKAESGTYIAPHVDWKNTTPEQRAALQSKPAAYLIVRNPGKFSMAAAIPAYFIYILVICIFVAYLAGHTLGPGTHYLQVFRVAGTAGILAFAFNTIADSIWYGKPWGVTVKHIIDGVIFGLLIAGTFGWLWPR